MSIPRTLTAIAASSVAMLAALCLVPAAASAAATEPSLGTAASYSVLAATTVTNTGPSVLAQNLGLSGNNAVTGFPPGLILGTSHVFDAAAGQAQADATGAATTAAGLTATGSLSATTGTDTLLPGVYRATAALLLTSTLTLDGQGDPDAVFVIDVGTALTTASASSVVGINGAQACHVYWQIGTDATLGTDTSFTGTIIAGTSVTMNTGATLHGRALAQTAAVSLDSNTIDSPPCVAATPVTTSATPTVSASASDPVPTVTRTAIPIATTSTAVSATAGRTATPTATATSRVIVTNSAPTTGSSFDAPPATAVPGSPSGQPPRTLANTGTRATGVPLTAAGLCVLVGSLLIMITRRRRSRLS